MTDLEPIDVDRPYHIAIVGTGFSGLGMAISLLRSGVTNFKIYEAADEIGGTWRDNVYPGAACDVPSHLYSFSFAPNPNWSRSYAPQAEILEYMKDVVEQFGVGPYIEFNSEITGATWDESSSQWILKINDDRELRADFVIAGCGGLSKPRIPDFDGLSTFEGRTFHTAEWDTTADLSGQRVGVIGTGASAIQIVPELVKNVGELKVFQRTPPWILPRPDRAITDVEKRAFNVLKPFQKAVRGSLYIRQEAPGWAFSRSPRTMRMLQKMAEHHLRSSVKDKKMRQVLTPDFILGCKRILVSSDYYPALQEPNAELVAQPVTRFTPSGVETNDGSYPLDAVVFATGFLASQDITPFRVIGRDGRSLSEEWEGDNMEAYKGAAVSGFPNLFILVGPNTGLGHNSMIIMIEAQIKYVRAAIETLMKKRLQWVDVRRDVQDAYNKKLQEEMKSTVWLSGCQSWYLTDSGKNTTLWPKSTMAFRRITNTFDLESYESEPL